MCFCRSYSLSLIAYGVEGRGERVSRSRACVAEVTVAGVKERNEIKEGQRQVARCVWGCGGWGWGILVGKGREGGNKLCRTRN